MWVICFLKGFLIFNLFLKYGVYLEKRINYKCIVKDYVFMLRNIILLVF